MHAGKMNIHSHRRSRKTNLSVKARHSLISQNKIICSRVPGTLIKYCKRASIHHSREYLRNPTPPFADNIHYNTTQNNCMNSSGVALQTTKL